MATPWRSNAAAAAAQLHQSCLTLCDPRDGSPPGSPVHGILQAQEHWSGLPFPGEVMSSQIQVWVGPLELSAFSLPLRVKGQPLLVPAPQFLHCKLSDFFFFFSQMESGNHWSQTKSQLETDLVQGWTKSHLNWTRSNVRWWVNTILRLNK